MKDYFSRFEDFSHNIISTIVIAVFIFIIDILTPTGSYIKVLYLIPLLLIPSKTISKNKFYLVSSGLTILIWAGLQLSPQGIEYHTALINRVIMTLILWVIAYLQAQRIKTYQKLSRSEEDAKRNEEQFRIAKEVSPDGFATLQPYLDKNGALTDFIFTFQNEAAAKMSRTDPFKITGKRFLELFPDQRAAQFFRTYKEVFEAQRPKEFEYYSKGEPFKDEAWFRIVAIPTSDGIAVHAQDITGRKKVEEALRKANEQYDLLFNSIEEGFAHYEAIYDGDGKVNDLRVIEINPAGAKLSGVRREDQIGRTWKEVWTGIEDELFEIYDEVDKSGKPIRFEILSGITNRWYINNLIRLAPGHIAVTFFDITERKQAEQALRENEERFRMTFERAAIGIAYILPDGQWLKVNDKYCQMFGYTREELNDITFKQITHPDDLELDLQMREKLLNGSIESFTIEKRYIKKGGDIKWALLTCSLAHEESTGLKYMISVLEDITELKYLQEINERNLKALEKEHTYLEALTEELKRNQLKYEKAEALAHVGSWQMNLKTDIAELSGEMNRIMGLDPSAKSLHIDEFISFIHPDDKKMISEVYSKIKKEGEPADLEYRIVRRDGEIRYVHGISAGADEVARGIEIRFGAITDITERKTAELSLMESESRLLDAQRLAHVGSFTLDLVTGRAIWSEETYRIYELDPDKEVPYMKEITSMFHPADRAWIADKINEGMDKDTLISFECRLLLRGHKVKYIRYIARPLYDETGKPIKRIGAVVDITESKLQQIKLEKTLLKLKKSEAQLLEAQKLGRMGNYSIDFKNGGKMEWSDEMYNIWELDKSKPLPGVDEVWENVHPDDLAELKETLYNQQPGGERVEAVFRILFPNNRVKYVHVVTRVVYDEEGNLLRREGIEMDITERKLAQIALEKTLKKLEESNEELQQFAYIASHDLQEPLRMVSSYMGLLEKKYTQALDEKASEFIHFAIDGSKRMSNLINDLLAYSRVTTQAKEFSAVDLNDTFSDVTHDLQVLIKEKGAVISSEKLPVIMADPVQMHQLLQNLIGNAVKFHNDNMPEVFVNAEKIKQSWRFSVKDNGIGIDPQFYHRIFAVFQRLHEREKYEGTGIGLAVCKKIVERHGGRIWVESEPGKGSIFYFTFPAAM